MFMFEALTKKDYCYHPYTKNKNESKQKTL